MVPFVGNNFDSLAFSPASVVYAAEIIKFSRKFRAGFSLEPGEIGLDEILSLGPGANYMESEQTLKKFRAYMQTSRIWPTLSLEKWQEMDCPKAGNTLRAYTDKLLGEVSPTGDHGQLLSEGEKFIKNFCETM